MRHWATAPASTRALLPVPQRLLLDTGSSFIGGVLSRRDCAVRFTVILPMGIAVEHVNSAPPSRRGFCVLRRNVGLLANFAFLGTVLVLIRVVCTSGQNR